MTGTLVLPFGLALQSGVRLKVDNTAPTDVVPFSTCLYDGCVVSLSLGEKTTVAVRAGNVLLVMAKGSDSSPVELGVSLKGASKAADRVLELVSAPAK